MRRNPQPGLYADVGPRKGREEYPAVYLLKGGVTHLLDPSLSPNSDRPALCGLRPAYFTFWLGTGSAGEYDIARSMPLCIRCAKLSRPEELE